MKSPCAGVTIYAQNPKLLADFYQGVVGLRPYRAEAGFIALESASFQLVVVKTPERLSRVVTIGTPPVRRENAAIKPVFFVESLARAREAAAKSGGVLDEKRREWTFEDTTVCDGSDPEGNVYQLRERNE